MVEEEVNYASVVFTTNNLSPSQDKKEETVYDEVKVQSEAAKQTADINDAAGSLPDKEADNNHHNYQQLACCLGILCVILLLGIIAVCVYVAKNPTTLAAAIHKLSSDNENLRRDHSNLTDQLSNLTQNYTVLESMMTNLTAENKNLTTQQEQLSTRYQELETRYQELETQRINLTEQIRDMEANWNELNVSRAQWSIDAYCPIKDDRQCKSCQDGWELTKPSCYAINDAEFQDRKTWEEARENCRGKSADFTVAHTQEEKDIINDYSWGSSGPRGYWIGLKVEDGKWKWIDGSELTESSWIDLPTDGHCAISVQNKGWKSVRCDVRQQWICIKNALSV